MAGTIVANGYDGEQGGPLRKVVRNTANGIQANLQPTMKPIKSILAGLKDGQTLRVTPEIAKKMLEEFHFEYQRRVSPGHVEKLVASFKHESNTKSAIRIVKVGNAFYLTDGQHRLHAVAQAGVTINVTVILTEGKEKRDVAHDYQYGSGSERIRTPMEKIVTSGILQAADMNATNASALVAGVMPIVCGLTPSSFNILPPALSIPYYREKAVGDFIADAKQYFRDIYDAPKTFSRSFRRKPVVALALITYQYMPNEANQLWRAAAENDGLRRGEPAHTLVYWLATYGAKEMRDPVFFGHLCRIWNSHVKGERNSAPKRMDAPYEIAGTPYDGTSFYFPYGDGS